MKLTHKEKLAIRKMIYKVIDDLNLEDTLIVDENNKEHDIDHIKKGMKINYHFFNKKLQAYYTNDLEDADFFRQIDPFFNDLNYIPLTILNQEWDAPIDFINMRRKNILNKIID